MIRRLFQLVPGEQRHLIPRYAAYLLLYVLAQSAAYLTLVPLLTALLGGDGQGTLVWLAVLAVMVVLVFLTNYLQGMVGFEIAAHMIRRVQTSMGDRLGAMPLGWFTAATTGQVSRTVSSSAADLATMFAHLLAPMITAIVVPVGVAIGMLSVDWRVSLAMLISAPLLWLINRWAGGLHAKQAAEADTAAEEANARVIEFAQLQSVLRGFGATVSGDAQLDRALAAQRRAAMRGLRLALPTGLIFAGVVQATFIVLVYLLVGFALGGSLSPVAAVALFVVAARFVDPLSTFIDYGSAMRQIDVSVSRIQELLQAPVLDEPAQSAVPIDASIEFRGTVFGYEPGATVIDRLDLVVPAGSTVALVGPSGSGKTTLTRLVPRFYDPQEGAVLIGGHDVRDYDSQTLLAQLTLVFQDVYLFDASILENVRMGRPDATDEEVLAAATAARVDELVARLPDGWNTGVGEGGTALSGGERQRISIARALLKDAPVVLLDEATSSLDSENEAAVVAGMRRLARDRTVLVVAHRLTTIRHADRIVFLEAGRIVEQGTHDELLALGGRYAAFWQERLTAQGWRLTRTDA